MNTRNLKQSLLFFLVAFVALSLMSISSISARADGSRVVVGGAFIDYFGDLIELDDSPEMKYTWEKIGGSGELTGGTSGGTGTGYNENEMKFYAAKVGDITIRLKAVLGNNVIRTATRSYQIINPYDSYDWYCNEVKHPGGNGWTGDTTMSRKDLDSEFMQSGSTFTIEFITWKNWEMPYDTSVLPYPTLSDITWKQTGKGSVVEVSNSANPLSRTFKAVNIGDMTLTFMSKDGKWSRSVSFKVHPDQNTMEKLPQIDIYKKKTLQASYSGGDINFEINNLKGKPKNIVKKFDVVSSDNSIATPGTIYWDTEDDITWYYFHVFMHKAGTVTISFIDTKYGEVLESVKLKLTDQMVTNTWKKSAYIVGVDKYLYYGDPYLQVSAYEGDTVTLSLGKKTWKKTVPASGRVKFKIPLYKPGTKGKVTFKKAGSSLTVTKKFTVKDKASLQVSNVTSSSKKMTIFLSSGVKGDVIKITAGKKKYTKKLKKTTYSEEEEGNYGYRYKQKIDKLERGTKIKIVVYNKFKQVRCKKTVTVK